MEAYELPLVIFTVFSQWSVGIIVAIALLEWLKPKFMESVGTKAMRIPIFIALGVSAIGMFASLLHLNNPFKSYTSLLGMGHSWLSREIVAVILFNVFLVALTYIWWKKAEQISVRKSVGTLTALIGILLIISSATVYYSIPLHAAWNNWTTFANFLLTGLLLGGLTVTYFVVKSKEEKTTDVLKVLGIYLSLIIVALVATLAGSAIISGGAIESQQIAATISFSSILYWIRILGSLLIPATIVVYMIRSKKLISMKYVMLATVLVLVGELSGRAMFYYSVMSQYPWF